MGDQLRCQPRGARVRWCWSSIEVTGDRTAGGSWPRYAHFVIDKLGTVAWARIESNYRERPTNDEIRAALNGLK